MKILDKEKEQAEQKIEELEKENIFMKQTVNQLKTETDSQKR